MAVLQMKKIHVAGMKRDKRKMIEFLQRQGVVELISSEDLDSVFELNDCTEKIENLKNQQNKVLNALTIIDNYSPEKTSMLSSLEGRKHKTVEEYEVFSDSFIETFNKAEEVCELENKIKKTKNEIIALKETFESLFPWLNLTVPLNYSGTKTTTTFIGSVPRSYEQKQLEEDLANIKVYPESAFVEIIYENKEQTCLVATCLKSDSKYLKDALGEIEFSFPLKKITEIPKVAEAKLKKEIEAKELEIEKDETTISGFGELRSDFKFLADYLSIQIDKNKAYTDVAESKYTFILEGFIIENKSENVRSFIENNFDCMATISELEEGDDVPSLMKNSWFSEPVESVVSSYSYPTYGGIDPTTVASIFYYVMFGLMFSDAGYGFALALICGICLIKFKNMESSTSKFLRLFFWCGISTIFWGIIFSSYFGDVVDVVSKNFFGKHVTIPPIWFSPLKEPMKLLIFCLGIGIIHLTTGYIVNAYNSIKNKDPMSAIYDAVFPVAFMFSLLTIFITTDMFKGMSGFSTTISEGTKNICLIIAGICAVGVILTGGRESKSWGKRLLKGIFAFYNVIAGWISDILSYSRLLALGLATGVIASVVNTLGSMLGKGFAAAIGFVIIFLAGHAMNFGINILGSYVHSNRLEYVEFFGKFYDGGGREFNPLRINTKYYNIKEDISNG